MEYYERMKSLRISHSMTQEEGNATVCWYFNCVNEQDNALTEFYVNARTGDIKTYTRYSG